MVDKIRRDQIAPHTALPANVSPPGTATVEIQLADGTLQRAQVQHLPGGAGGGGPSAEWLSGAGAPANGLGADGDWYINETNADVYGPKTAGAWGSVVLNLAGPGFVSRGVFSTLTTYVRGDVVSYQNGAYVAKGATTGNAPTNATFWDVLFDGAQVVADALASTPRAENAAGQVVVATMKKLKAGANISVTPDPADPERAIVAAAGAALATENAAGDVIAASTAKIRFGSGLSIAADGGDPTRVIIQGAGGGASTSSAVTHLTPGAGAVALPVLNYLRHIFKPSAFGAAGNPLAQDDTADFIQMFDALKTLGAGGVDLEGKNYRIYGSAGVTGPLLTATFGEISSLIIDANGPAKLITSRSWASPAEIVALDVGSLRELLIDTRLEIETEAQSGAELIASGPTKGLTFLQVRGSCDRLRLNAKMTGGQTLLRKFRLNNGLETIASGLIRNCDIDAETINTNLPVVSFIQGWGMDLSLKSTRAFRAWTCDSVEDVVARIESKDPIDRDIVLSAVSRATINYHPFLRNVDLRYTGRPRSADTRDGGVVVKLDGVAPCTLENVSIAITQEDGATHKTAKPFTLIKGNAAGSGGDNTAARGHKAHFERLHINHIAAGAAETCIGVPGAGGTYGDCTGEEIVISDLRVNVTGSASATLSVLDAATLVTGVVEKFPGTITGLVAPKTGSRLASVTITGGGLATGGGDLSVNRTITVPKASAAQAQAAADDATALTPAGLGSFMVNRLSRRVFDGANDRSAPVTTALKTFLETNAADNVISVIRTGAYSTWASGGAPSGSVLATFASRRGVLMEFNDVDLHIEDTANISGSLFRFENCSGIRIAGALRVFREGDSINHNQTGQMNGNLRSPWGFVFANGNDDIAIDPFYMKNMDRCISFNRGAGQAETAITRNIAPVRFHCDKVFYPLVVSGAAVSGLDAVYHADEPGRAFLCNGILNSRVVAIFRNQGLESVLTALNTVTDSGGGDSTQAPIRDCDFELLQNPATIANVDNSNTLAHGWWGDTAALMAGLRLKIMRRFAAGASSAATLIEFTKRNTGNSPDNVLRNHVQTNCRYELACEGGPANAQLVKFPSAAIAGTSFSGETSIETLKAVVALKGASTIAIVGDYAHMPNGLQISGETQGVLTLTGSAPTGSVIGPLRTASGWTLPNSGGVGPVVAVTPVWGNDGTPNAIGNGQLLGWVQDIGNLRKFWGSFAPGSTTQFGNGTWWFEPPAPYNQNAARTGVGTAKALKPGNSWQGGEVHVAQGTCRAQIATSGAGSSWASGAPFSWAVNDVMWFHVEYPLVVS